MVVRLDFIAKINKKSRNSSSYRYLSGRYLINLRMMIKRFMFMNLLFIYSILNLLYIL